MDKLKKAFGYSDPLARGQKGMYSSDAIDSLAYKDAIKRYHQTATQYQQTMMQAQNAARNLGVQNMAGGGVGIGMAHGQYASSSSYQPWGQQLSPVQIRDKTRAHIAEEVEKMAEEIGAPTLLHAVVLAIRAMDIPE